jgi:hypothetical protein
MMDRCGMARGSLCLNAEGADADNVDPFLNTAADPEPRNVVE